MKRYRRKFNKKAKVGKSQRSKYFKPMGNTNNLYRPRIPRTLQIATRRPTYTTLRFVKNMTFKVEPQLNQTQGVPINAQQNCCLTINANAITNILPYSVGNNGTNFQENTNIGQIWYSQNPTDYGPPLTVGQGVVTHAEGVERFQDIYKHYTVLGSRCQVTYEPYGTNSGDPATLYIGLNSAPANAITPLSDMADINSQPYFKRAQVLGNPNAGSGQGVRVYQNYSARKFEGVKDPTDNSILRGSFPTSDPVAASVEPNEKTFYKVGIMNTISEATGNQGVAAPRGVMRIKVEYITRVTEPTQKNPVSQPMGNLANFNFENV